MVGGVDCIYVDQDRERWRALVNTVMNFTSIKDVYYLSILRALKRNSAPSSYYMLCT
jgi:hypothetical protein